MTRYVRLMIALLAVCAILVAGCGKNGADKENPEKTGDQAAAPSITAPTTPEEGVRAALDAFGKKMADKDMEAAMTMMDVPPAMKNVMIATVAYAKVAEGFKAKLVKAYGEQAATALGQGPGAGDPGAEFEKMAAMIKDAKITMTGPDTATVTHPDESQPLAMKKVDGRWRISMPDEAAKQMEQMPKDVIDAMAGGMEGMADVMKQLEPNIGKGTLQEFMMQYGQAMQNNPKIKKMGEAMMKMMSEGMQKGMQPGGGTMPPPR
jgi:hypothetical protein